MTLRNITIAFTLLSIAGNSPPLMSTTTASDPRLPAFEFVLESASSAEEAANALFIGCATHSPKHFVKHLSLATCEGPVDTLQNFAECMHKTEFRSRGESFTYYDLPARIRRDTVRVVASRKFDAENAAAACLHAKYVYYAETLIAVDVAASDSTGRDYQTRIVVAGTKNNWYAVPRVRQSQPLYEIADAM